MRKIIFALILTCPLIFSHAQIIEANIIIDYSEASICGMDEGTFSEYETEWNKDKPEINYKLISAILKISEDCFKYKKDAQNTLLIKVYRVTVSGGFICDVTLEDANKSVLKHIDSIYCKRGGIFGTKLHIIKRGATIIGKKIGTALRNELLGIPPKKRKYF